MTLRLALYGATPIFLAACAAFALSRLDPVIQAIQNAVPLPF